MSSSPWGVGSCAGADDELWCEQGSFGRRTPEDGGQQFDRAAADRHIAATLRRRGTAETRIGVPYEPVPTEI